APVVGRYHARRAAVHPPFAGVQRGGGRLPRRCAAFAMRSSSASVHSFAFIAAAPILAAARMAFRLPGVVPRPPTPKARRQRHTTLTLTPNQYRSATVLSVRIARASVSLAHKPQPPRCCRGCTRGHGIGASLQLVTLQSRSRYRHVTRSPR